MLNSLQQALYLAPFHMGVPAGPHVVGRSGTPGEGPFLTMYLSADGGTIIEAWFETYGCPTAIACGSWVTKWVAGRTVEQARVLTAGDLERVLGGLALGKEHCAALAVNALQDGLRRLMRRDSAAAEGGMG